MAFFTCIKSTVPILGDSTPHPSEDKEGGGGVSSPLNSSFATPTPTPGLMMRSSTETVDTLTEDDDVKEDDMVQGRSSSQNSTPTPHRQVERFVYEVDPELGAFV